MINNTDDKESKDTSQGQGNSGKHQIRSPRRNSTVFDKIVVEVTDGHGELEEDSNNSHLRRVGMLVRRNWIDNRPSLVFNEGDEIVFVSGSLILTEHTILNAEKLLDIKYTRMKSLTDRS